MDDRELLELAAKAAGRVLSFGDEGVLWKAPGDKYFTGKWNPLEDDGDALRLALDMRIDLASVQCAITWDDADRYAASRRAITIAAAEIGKRSAIKARNESLVTSLQEAKWGTSVVSSPQYQQEQAYENARYKQLLDDAAREGK